VCKTLKIKSLNQGFNFGIMQVGPQKGKKVLEAKPLIKKEMMDAG
jgi:hypothetical protein